MIIDNDNGNIIITIININHNNNAAGRLLPDARGGDADELLTWPRGKQCLVLGYRFGGSHPP